MPGYQAALGAAVAAALVFGNSTGPTSQVHGQSSAVVAMVQFGQPIEAVFDGLQRTRNAALDVVFDAVGALIAQAKQF